MDCSLVYQTHQTNLQYTLCTFTVHVRWRLPSNVCSPSRSLTHSFTLAGSQSCTLTSLSVCLSSCSEWVRCSLSLCILELVFLGAGKLQLSLRLLWCGLYATRKFRLNQLQVSVAFNRNSLVAAEVLTQSPSTHLPEDCKLSSSCYSFSHISELERQVGHLLVLHLRELVLECGQELGVHLHDEALYIFNDRC